MTRATPERGPGGSPRGLPVVRGIEPVGGPLPDVASHLVHAVAVGVEGLTGAVPAYPSAIVFSAGKVPGRRSCGAPRRVPAHRPTGTCARRARPVRRTPTRPRSAGASPSTRRTRARHSTIRARLDARARSSTAESGPSGCAQSAPSTWRHHGASATAAGWREVIGEEAREHKRPAEPLRIAAVSGRRHERGELRVRDRMAEIENGESETSWAGPSPSATYPCFPFVPMRMSRRRARRDPRRSRQALPASVRSPTVSPATTPDHAPRQVHSSFRSRFDQTSSRGRTGACSIQCSTVERT